MPDRRVRHTQAGTSHEADAQRDRSGDGRPRHVADLPRRHPSRERWARRDDRDRRAACRRPGRRPERGCPPGERRRARVRRFRRGGSRGRVHADPGGVRARARACRVVRLLRRRAAREHRLRLPQPAAPPCAPAERRARGTFWAGLGAIRRRAFLAAGGFDELRFPEPSIEDIELGMRLAADGAWIELDPSLQATHLKQWPLLRMLRTDLFQARCSLGGAAPRAPLELEGAQSRSARARERGSCARSPGRGRHAPAARGARHGHRLRLAEQALLRPAPAAETRAERHGRRDPAPSPPPARRRRVGAARRPAPPPAIARTRDSEGSGVVPMSSACPERHRIPRRSPGVRRPRPGRHARRCSGIRSSRRRAISSSLRSSSRGGGLVWSIRRRSSCATTRSRSARAEASRSAGATRASTAPCTHEPSWSPCGTSPNATGRSRFASWACSGADSVAATRSCARLEPESDRRRQLRDRDEQSDPGSTPSTGAE